MTILQPKETVAFRNQGRQNPLAVFLFPNERLNFKNTQLFQEQRTNHPLNCRRLFTLLGTVSDLRAATWHMKEGVYLYIFSQNALSIVPETMQNALKNPCSWWYVSSAFFTIPVVASHSSRRTGGEWLVSLAWVFILILKPFICGDSCKVSLQGFCFFFFFWFILLYTQISIEIS